MCVIIFRFLFRNAKETVTNNAGLHAQHYNFGQELIAVASHVLIHSYNYFPAWPPC